jgi:hypothetical protein
MVERPSRSPARIAPRRGWRNGGSARRKFRCAAARIDALDNEFYADPEPLEVLLAEYARQHAAALTNANITARNPSLNTAASIPQIRARYAARCSAACAGSTGRKRISAQRALNPTERQAAASATEPSSASSWRPPNPTGWRVQATECRASKAEAQCRPESTRRQRRGPRSSTF